MADLLVFLRRGAHERDRGVVLVQVSGLILLGDGFPRPEVNHVVGADRHDGGHAVQGSRAAAVGACGKHAPDDLVAPFGGGQIEHALDEAAVDQRFHAFSARSRRVKHEHLEALRLQIGLRLLHGGGGHAEHGRGDERLVVLVLGGNVLEHARHGGDGVVEDGRREGVDARHVDDRGEHGDVRRADVGRRVARRHGGHHDLRHADGQLAHAGGRDGGAARSTHGEHAIEAAVRVERGQKFLDAARHGLGGESAVLLLHDGRHLDIDRRRDFRVGNVGHGLRVEDAAVDGEGVDAQLLKAGFHIGEFLAFRVERADDSNCFHTGLLT